MRRYKAACVSTRRDGCAEQQRPASSAAGDHNPRLLVKLFVVGLLLGGIAAACAPGRSLEAVRVLRDIEAGSRPSGLKETTPAPLRTFVRFGAGDAREGDLYLPGEAAKAGLVLVPGLTPRGRDDARLVDFATTLARARFEVLVPDLPHLRALQVTADDAVPIADAARHLAGRLAERPLGIAAVSFAVGPAVLALGEPGVRADFFLGIGGYWDLEALVTYVTTGFYRHEGGWAFRPPKAYGKWVFVLSNAGRLGDAHDAALLTGMADRKLADKDADIADLAGALGSGGRAVYALVTNPDPERVPELLAALPPELGEEIGRLDLKRRDLAHIPVRFVLIHDRSDRIIPAEQSEALAASLNPGQASVYIAGGLDHAQVKNPGIGDALTLFEAVNTVLRLRDGDIPEHALLPFR